MSTGGGNWASIIERSSDAAAKRRHRVVCVGMSLGLWALVAAGWAASATSGEPFVDARDGRTYRTVEIAGITWFAENLAWAAPESFCYGDEAERCVTDGRLYRWETALAACPPGSHLASELEWQALERAVGLPEVEIEQRGDRGTIEGARLKAGGETGFEVRFAGWRRYEDGTFRARGENAAFWASTEVDLAHAQHRDLDVEDDQIWRSPVPKHYALSVRCVVDRYDEDEYPGDDTHPVFSPDGTHLAFISNRVGVTSGRGVNFEIYLLDLATKRERRLTFNDDFEADIAWSPDGSRIAFKSYRDQNDEIYVMAADGSGQRSLTRHPASDGSPSFTPDGDFLWFHSDRDGNRELYRMRADGTAVERMTEHPASDNSPSVSPNGRLVAFVSNRDGNDEVYLLEVASGETRRLTDSPLADWSPVWSPDGAFVLVTRGDWDTDRWSLYRIAVASGAAELLFEGNDSGNGSWRHDGVVAFGAATTSREGEPGPGRIHLALPGGAPPKPLTGRLAGTFNGGRRSPDEGGTEARADERPSAEDVMESVFGNRLRGGGTWRQDNEDPATGAEAPKYWLQLWRRGPGREVVIVDAYAVGADDRCSALLHIVYRYDRETGRILSTSQGAQGLSGHGFVRFDGTAVARETTIQLPDRRTVRIREAENHDGDNVVVQPETWSDEAWLPGAPATWFRASEGEPCR